MVFNKQRISKIKDSMLFWPIVALLLLLLFNLIFTKNFFHVEIKDGHFYGNVIDIINRATPLMFLAIGMTLVIATGGIDISVGSVLAISGALVASLIGQQSNGSIIPMPIAIIIALLVCAMLGLWNGFLVSRLGVQPMVATLILLTAGRGISQLITSGQIITVNYKPFFFLGSGFLLGFPFSIFVVAAFFAIIILLVKKTSFGLFLESSGSNTLASKFSGLDVKKVILTCYVICGLCAGIAGLIITSEVQSADANNAGLFMELDAILSVVLGGNSMLGGRFSVGGSVIGALIVQTLTTTIYAIGVPSEVTMVVKALVVVVICLIQAPKSKKIKAKHSLNAKEVRYEEIKSEL